MSPIEHPSQQEFCKTSYWIMVSKQWMRSGWLHSKIFWMLLVWGRLCVSKTIIPEAEEHFFTPSGSRDTHIVGGLGLNAYKV